MNEDGRGLDKGCRVDGVRGMIWDSYEGDSYG